MSTLELGLIGNGTVAALINQTGDVTWFCLPRLDGEPVFNSLLGGQGKFSISLAGLTSATHAYRQNTAVLETILEAEDGSAICITDFAPRFSDKGRMFRPASMVRTVRPLRGAPKIRINLVAASGRGAGSMSVRRGVSHISFLDDAAGFRITTNAPISYILQAQEFRLDEEYSFILGPDEPLSENPINLAADWEVRTTNQWRDWSRRLATPPEWQAAVIRAAITLKLCVYEETGGIVAALTTSIPEHASSIRNWDYRFCWLRDAYFTVSALNRLSAMGTLERYLNYLRNIVSQTQGGHIQPVYGIALEQELTEEISDHLPGYRGMGPVRFGNQAAEHVQHDVYGHVILGEAQAFLDERLQNKSGPAEFAELEAVGERAYRLYNTPDAGIWEYRGREAVHTSSAIMCWAACDRLSRIARFLNIPSKACFWSERAAEISQTILDKAWNPERGAFTGTFGGDTLDASVLLMTEVGFIAPRDPRYISTVEAIDTNLREGHHIYRYRTKDDFGYPKTAFTACTFWHIDALIRIGERHKATEMFEAVLARRTQLGLLSEDVATDTGELWGNFPQTYSMVGIINAASRLSQSWDATI